MFIVIMFIQIGLTGEVLIASVTEPFGPVQMSIFKMENSPIM